MAVTKACANCRRILSVIGEGCCYVCYHAGKGLSGPAKDDARAAIKARIESGGLKRTGGGRRKSAPMVPVTVTNPVDATDLKATPPVKRLPDVSQIARTAPARVAEGVPVISLAFADERDRHIYDILVLEACHLRRTPEQQILWIVQNTMEREVGLLAEASGRE